MRRREFIAGLGSAAAWPLAARAQQSRRMRHIGVLLSGAPGDPDSQNYLAAFAQGLQAFGWTIGGNMRIDVRQGSGGADREREYAAELLALEPDVLMTNNGQTLRRIQEATRTVPIVFVSVLDPVGQGLVASLARPGGNATGFSGIEFGLGAKLLQLLKEVAPRLNRAAVIRTITTGGIGQFGAIQSTAPSFGVELTPVDARDAGVIKREVTAFAHVPNGGMIVTASAFSAIHRETIIALAAGLGLPAIYPARSYVAAGGLISYAPVYLDAWRSAAGYVDRILKGEKPADLPVQAPTRYELAINLKTAKTLGLTVPETLLVQADEVIQ